MDPVDRLLLNAVLHLEKLMAGLYVGPDGDDPPAMAA